VVEAMMSHRLYRPGLGIETALTEIELNKGVPTIRPRWRLCVDLLRNEGFNFNVVPPRQ